MLSSWWTISLQNRKLNSGLQDGARSNGFGCQAPKPEFDFQNPHEKAVPLEPQLWGGRKEALGGLLPQPIGSVQGETQKLRWGVVEKDS